MKNLSSKIAATALATVLLGTGAASSALAEGSSPPAVQQQSNVQDVPLTEEILVGPLGVDLYLELGGERAGRVLKNLSRYGNIPVPNIASPAVKAADGSEWRAVSTGFGNDNEILYIQESGVVSSAKLGTDQAAQDAAGKVRDTAYKKHMAQFSGDGVVASGGSWYAEEDLSGEAMGQAFGFGLEGRMSEPYDVNGKSVRKLGLRAEDMEQGPAAVLAADAGGFTAYVLASDVTDFTADAPEPAETPTPTYGATAGPQPGNQPAAPEVPTEENETSPPDDESARSDGWEGDALDDLDEMSQEDPGSIWPIMGGGVLVAGAAGAWLFWTSRKGRGSDADEEDAASEDM